MIRLVVMMYVKYPLSLRNVEAERGIDISHETVRFWWNRAFAEEHPTHYPMLKNSETEPA